MINLKKDSFLGVYFHLLYEKLPTSKAGVVIKSILPIPLFPLILVTWLVYFTKILKRKPTCFNRWMNFYLIIVVIFKLILYI